MDFDLNNDQKEIKAVARELLSARSPFAKVREAAEAGRPDAALWREVVELGWPGIAVAEEHGGQGLGFVELAVLLEELGYACAATPFLGNAVAAALISATGSAEQRSRWLPGLVSGEIAGGVGTRELVIDAEPGAAIVIVVDGDEASVVPDPSLEPFDAIDSTRRFSRLAAGDGEPLETGAAERM